MFAAKLAKLLFSVKGKRAQEGSLSWGRIVGIILALIGLIILIYAIVKAGKLGSIQLGGLE